MNVKEAMMNSVGERSDLREVGTRYDHYMELKEVFMLGIAVIDGMQPYLRSESDMRTKLKLAHAVELIEKRLAYLADYDNKVYALNKEIRAAGIHRSPQLTDGGSNAKPPQDINQPSSPEDTRRTTDQRPPIKGGWPEA